MRNPNAKVSDPNDFVSCPGDLFEIQYSSKVMPDGTIVLKESGKIDIKQMINSQRESTDIAYIMNAIENGDESMLNPNGFYGDMTQFPKTFAEMLQLRIDAEESFYGLSPSVRQKFDNDFNQYFALAGSPEWYEKLGIAKKNESEVTSNVDES